MLKGITTRDETKGIDPFEKCITIVYVCNLVYRTLYMESERIDMIPPHGYLPEQKYFIKVGRGRKIMQLEQLVFIDAVCCCLC